MGRTDRTDTQKNGQLTLLKLIEGYWLYKRSTVSPRTVRDYSLTFDRLVAYMGRKVTLDELTRDDVARFLDWVCAEYKLGDKSRINVWIALSSLWTWAEEILKLPHLVRGIPRPEYHPPAIEILTRPEIVAILRAAQNKSAWKTSTGKQSVPPMRPTAMRDEAIILTLLDVGLRASELCDLCLRDLDTESGRLHIRHGKGDKARYVFLGDTARRSVWRYLGARKAATPGDPLFATSAGGHIDRDNLRHILERCAQRASIRHVWPHLFRHTFAVTFLRNGGNVLELQAILGHEQMETIKIYVRLAQVDLKEASRRSSPADNWRL